MKLILLKWDKACWFENCHGLFYQRLDLEGFVIVWVGQEVENLNRSCEKEFEKACTNREWLLI